MSDTVTPTSGTRLPRPAVAPAVRPPLYQPHVRKIVLYGRPASGKTCFLAALAMPRKPHEEGHSCIWVNDSQTIATPAGHRESWDPNDPVVARYLGKEWLQRSIDAISAGGVPRATPNDAAPFRLLFDVTQTTGRIQRLEMVDYSGELVDPNLSEDVLAKKLLTHLEEADGILVLAEAPKQGEKYHELYRELQILQQALMLVSSKRRQLRADPLPIAMLLNKWDRYSKMAEYDAEVARLEVDEFINQKPVVPQRALFNVLQSVGGSLENDPYSVVFPVSAFGRTRRVKNESNGSGREVEVPEELTPLPSYGLEDPLVWVCQRADQLDLHELKTSISRLAFWKIWQVPGRSALLVSAEALKIRKRFPERLPEAQTLASCAAKAKACFQNQLGALVTVCCFLILSSIQAGYLAYDSAAYAQAFKLRRELDAGADPVPLHARLEDSTSFLAGYSKPSWYRSLSQLFVLTPASAKQHHERLRSGLEEANHIVTVADEIGTKFESLVSAAVLSPNPSEVRNLLAQLEAIPLPEDSRIADLVGNRKEQAAKRIRERFGDLENQIATGQLATQFNNEMRECRLPEAVAVLTQNKAAHPEAVASLEGDFKNRWFTLLHGKVVELARAKEWGSIDSLLRKVRDDRMIVDIVGFRDVAQRVDGEKAKANEWHAWGDYNAFRASPHVSSLRQAVMQSGTDAHKGAVRSYEAYQTYLSTAQTWELVISGFASSNTGASSLGSGTLYRTRVYHSNQSILDETRRFSSGRVDVDVNFRSRELTSKPTDEVSLDFYTGPTDWSFGNPSFSGRLSGEAQRLTADNSVAMKPASSTIAGDPLLRVKLLPKGFTPLKAPQLLAAEDIDIR